eukprot:6270012-Ditylum_brightwellii.AAC.1
MKKYIHNFSLHGMILYSASKTRNWLKWLANCIAKTVDADLVPMKETDEHMVFIASNGICLPTSYKKGGYMWGEKGISNVPVQAL